MYYPIKTLPVTWFGCYCNMKYGLRMTDSMYKEFHLLPDPQ